MCQLTETNAYIINYIILAKRQRQHSRERYVSIIKLSNLIYYISVCRHFSLKVLSLKQCLKLYYLYVIDLV